MKTAILSRFTSWRDCLLGLELEAAFLVSAPGLAAGWRAPGTLDRMAGLALDLRSLSAVRVAEAQR